MKKYFLIVMLLYIPNTLFSMWPKGDIESSPPAITKQSSCDRIHLPRSIKGGINAKDISTEALQSRLSKAAREAFPPPYGKQSSEKYVYLLSSSDGEEEEEYDKDTRKLLGEWAKLHQKDSKRLRE